LKTMIIMKCKNHRIEEEETTTEGHTEEIVELIVETEAIVVEDTVGIAETVEIVEIEETVETVAEDTITITEAEDKELLHTTEPINIKIKMTMKKKDLQWKVMDLSSLRTGSQSRQKHHFQNLMDQEKPEEDIEAEADIDMVINKFKDLYMI
jgi:hypothetical protein